MPDALKDMYNRPYLEKLAAEIQLVYPPFQADTFVASVMDDSWEHLELKGRMRQITLNLGKYLPENFPEAIAVIDKVVADYGTDWMTEGFCMYFNDFVEVYGQEEAHWDISIAALGRYTRHASSEFAVRPFIIKHETRMMEQMYAWSKSEDEHLRRLSSEGCRPALPWAQALPAFKKDPSPVLPILEQLKADPSLYVRKSVANNLNDISKTHPDLVVNIAKDWYGKNEDTNWIVKHACRTLLKKGNREALKLFGFGDDKAVETSGFSLERDEVSIGGELNFSFTISTKTATKVRLEYGIDYMKANGKQNRKIFQISESAVEKGITKNYTKKHSFADVSTRKHYPGAHAVTLIVNGSERGTLDFTVSAEN